MSRIKALNWFQKGVLLCMTVMVLLFVILYAITIGRAGFLYHKTILIPEKVDGSTVYSGEIDGQQVQFTVSAQRTVRFQYGEKTYGPYTVKEDPTAIPKDIGSSRYMTGMELLCGEQVVFRGGVFDFGGEPMLYPESGGLTIRVEHGGVLQDKNGNVIDQMEPAPIDILELMGEPPMTHKGHWLGWVAGTFLCVAAAIHILFADELFHWKMSFRIQYADSVEPSDWEIAGRYLGWALTPILAMVLFIMGLQ